MNRFIIPIGVYEARVRFFINVKPDDNQEWLDDDMHWVTVKHPWGNSDIYLWESENLKAVVHEINHAVFHLLESRGVKDEEAHCYLHDYLVVKYRLKVDKINSKHSPIWCFKAP